MSAAAHGATLLGWVPEAFWGEVPPLPRPTAQAWLRAIDGTPCLVDDGEFGTVAVAAGERVLFRCLNGFPDANLRWRDGHCTIDGALVPDATCSVVGIPELSGISGDALAAAVREHARGDGDYPVLVYCWSEPIPFLVRGDVLTRLGAS